MHGIWGATPRARPSVRRFPDPVFLPRELTLQ